MKRVITIAAISLLVLAISAGAGNAKPSIYAGAGLAIPMGNFGDAYSTGIGGTAGVGFPINPTFEIGGRLAYSVFGNKVSGGPNWKSLEIMADGRYIFPKGSSDSKFEPFITAGLGFVNSKVGETTVSYGGYSVTVGGGSSTDLAINFGAGFDYLLSPTMKLFVEARYMNIMSSGGSTGYVPIRAGLKFLLGNK